MIDWRSLFSGQPEYVLGIDEVGYGALAGPVVVSVVAVPLDWNLPGLTDSKKLSAVRRESLDPGILPHVVLEGFLSAAEVDKRGAYKALQFLHESAVAEALRIFPGCPVILDGNQRVKGAISLPKADTLVPAVSAASVHAKVFRDHLMAKVLDEKYPDYDFKSNKGYGSKQHYKALCVKGICDEHRRTFLKFRDGQVVMPEKVAALLATEDLDE